MGGDCYMRLVTQHSTGIHARTNTADPETAVQQLVFMVLDSGTPGTPRTEIQFHQLLQGVVAGLDVRFRRANNHSRSLISGVFRAYGEEFETQLGLR